MLEAVGRFPQNFMTELAMQPDLKTPIEVAQQTLNMVKNALADVGQRVNENKGKVAAALTLSGLALINSACGGPGVSAQQSLPDRQGQNGNPTQMFVGDGEDTRPHEIITESKSSVRTLDLGNPGSVAGFDNETIGIAAGLQADAQKNNLPHTPFTVMQVEAPGPNGDSLSKKIVITKIGTSADSKFNYVLVGTENKAAAGVAWSEQIVTINGVDYVESALVTLTDQGKKNLLAKKSINLNDPVQTDPEPIVSVRLKKEKTFQQMRADLNKAGNDLGAVESIYLQYVDVFTFRDEESPNNPQTYKFAAFLADLKKGAEPTNPFIEFFHQISDPDNGVVANFAAATIQAPSTETALPPTKTATPQATFVDSIDPTVTWTLQPNGLYTRTPTPTTAPTEAPPTPTTAPTIEPTTAPIEAPTAEPTQAPVENPVKLTPINADLYLGEKSADLSSIGPNPEVADAPERINNARLLGLYKAAQTRGGYTESFETFLSAMASGNGPTFDIYVTTGTTLVGNKTKVSYSTNDPIRFIITSNESDANRGILLGRDSQNLSAERYAMIVQDSDKGLTIVYYIPPNTLTSSTGRTPNGRNAQVGLAFRNGMALLSASDEIQTGAGGENAYVSWTKADNIFDDLRTSLFQSAGTTQISAISAEE